MGLFSIVGSVNTVVSNLKFTGPSFEGIGRLGFRHSSSNLGSQMRIAHHHVWALTGRLRWEPPQVSVMGAETLVKQVSVISRKPTWFWKNSIGYKGLSGYRL
jgi:hypothetical protein